jgi:hypothetical protein
MLVCIPTAPLAHHHEIAGGILLPEQRETTLSEQSIRGHIQAGQALTEVDRRGAPRYSCDHLVGFVALSADGGEPGSARARNLSRTGIRLLTDRPFKARSRLNLCFPGITSAAFRTLAAHVVYAYQDNVGSWVLGCTFDEPLSQAELDALL